MIKLNKRYQSACLIFDLSKKHSLSEAVGILKKIPAINFDESVDIVIHLGVDYRQSSQMVRGMVNLPYSSGKKKVIIVLTDCPQEALAAGCDYAGNADLIKKIQDGWLSFDVMISKPSSIKEIKTIARILGPRGLMPSIKSGTITDNIADTIKQIRCGRVEFKMDKNSNIHLTVGRHSFDGNHLQTNILTAVNSVIDARPISFKGQYIKKVSLSSTMSPGIKLKPNDLLEQEID